MQPCSTSSMSTAHVNSVIPNDLIYSNDSYVNKLEAQAYATMQKMNQMQRWRWALRGIVIE